MMPAPRHIESGPTPAPRVAQPLRFERRAVSRPDNPFTILVIEDDADVRGLVRRYLAEEGHVVLEAEDGQAGLDLIETYKGRLDLVLTDVEMPRIDGITVAETLAALRPLLAVVCMSGGMGGRQMSERLGANPGTRYLAKPFSPEDLARVLDDELARQQEATAIAEAHQSVSRSFAIEERLMRAVDLVASAYRLQGRQVAGSAA